MRIIQCLNNACMDVHKPSNQYTRCIFKIENILTAIYTMSDDSDDFYGGDQSDEENFDDIIEKNKSSESSEDELSSASENADADVEGEIVDEIPNEYVQKIVVVKPENMITSDVMSKYEMTNYVVIRATQIAERNNCMVDITGLTDPIQMAKRELMRRKCPLVVRRFVGKRKNKKTGEVEPYYEFWDPAQMIFAVTYPDVD